MSRKIYWSSSIADMKSDRWIWHTILTHYLQYVCKYHTQSFALEYEHICHTSACVKRSLISQRNRTSDRMNFLTISTPKDSSTGNTITITSHHYQASEHRHHNLEMLNTNNVSSSANNIYIPT